MPSYIPCKKNDVNGFTFYVSLISQADTKLFQANPTLAGGDVQRAIDDGAPANLGTLPVVDADFTRRVKVVLSQAETNGDNITIIFSDAAGAEWCDLTINIQTSAQTLDEMDVNIDDIKTDTNELQTDWVDGGRLDQLIDAIKAITDALPDAGALTTIQTDLDNPNQYKADLTTLETRLSAIRAGYLDELDFDLQGTLTTIAGYIDAEVAAILAIVNNLPDAGALNDLAAIKAITDALPDAGALTTIQTDLDNPNQYKADLTTLETRLSALRAGYLDELAAGNIPADIDTLLLRLSAARALLLDEITAARMSELDAANLPADVDTILAAIVPEVTTILAEIQNAIYGLAAIRARGDIAWITGAGGGPAVFAAAVWDELLAGHITAGSASAMLETIRALVDELESGEKPIPKAKFKV